MTGNAHAAETFVEKQVRLVLEQQCAGVFMKLVARELRGYDFTLVAFDYGGGNVAFKTTLERSTLVETIKAMLERWRTGRLPERPGSVSPLLGPTELGHLNAIISGLLPAGTGFALVVGKGDWTVYIASTGRADATALFKDLLPRFEAEARAGSS